MAKNKYNGMLFICNSNKFYLRYTNDMWQVYLCNSIIGYGSPVIGGIDSIRYNLIRGFWKPLKWAYGHTVCKECK